MGCFGCLKCKECNPCPRKYKRNHQSSWKAFFTRKKDCEISRSFKISIYTSGGLQQQENQKSANKDLISNQQTQNVQTVPLLCEITPPMVKKQPPPRGHDVSVSLSGGMYFKPHLSMGQTENHFPVSRGTPQSSFNAKQTVKVSSKGSQQSNKRKKLERSDLRI